MMMLITPADFSRLSPGSQQELLSMFGANGQASTDELKKFEKENSETGNAAWESSVPGSGGASWEQSRPVKSPKTPRNSKKELVELSLEQARALIAHISPLSQKTLQQFVYGDLIPVDSLIGPSKDYADLTALRKSLVGGIVRRLRTVTGNREAVLFAANQDKSSLYLKSVNASALRQAFNLPARLSTEFDLDDHSSVCHHQEEAPGSSAPL